MDPFVIAVFAQVKLVSEPVFPAEIAKSHICGETSFTDDFIFYLQLLAAAVTDYLL